MFNYDKLEKAVAESGKTKTYLCNKLGRPKYYLRDVIRQKNAIPEEYQTILAAELGVTVAYLNDEPEEIKKDPTPKTGNEVSDLDAFTLNILHKLTPEFQEKAIAHLLELAAKSANNE